MQFDNGISVLEGQAYIEDLKERAFGVLPKFHRYDDKRNLILPVGYINRDDLPPVRFYEEFVYDLDFACELENESLVQELGREMTRIENNIDLIGDVGDFPDPDWLVEGFIVRSGLTLIYGFPGSFKTTLMMYVTDAIQKGRELFGLKCKSGSVIWIEQDESGDLLKSHRDLVGLPYPLHIAKCDVMWNANKRHFDENLEKILTYYKPELVVIDSYTSLGIPDITRPDSGLVIDELRRLAKTHRCAFVIIHHPNQSGEQMGNTLHIAKMDSIASVSKMKSKIVFTQEKIRGMKVAEKILDVNETTLAMNEAKGTLKEAVEILVSQGVGTEEIKKSFPKAKKATIGKYIRDVKNPKITT